jgi:hypothetical protein
VVHQVGDAGDRRRRERQLLDQLRAGERRRRDVRALRVVDVVREPNGDAALRGGGERVLDDRLQVVRQVEVVDRDLERALRAGEEVGERVRGAIRGLRAVAECLQLDQDASARIRAL